MSITPLALKAYTQALQSPLSKPAAGQEEVRSFSDTMKESLSTVNTLRKQSVSMVEDFATGKNQNVHELMIAMQKASLATSMTSAVRSKLLEAYKEVIKMPF